LRRAREQPTGPFVTSQQLAAEMLGLNHADREAEPAAALSSAKPRRRRR
jgi:hypothetical protein